MLKEEISWWKQYAYKRGFLLIKKKSLESTLEIHFQIDDCLTENTTISSIWYARENHKCVLKVELKSQILACYSQLAYLAKINLKLLLT